MLDYALLTKAINNLEKKKVQQEKPKVDAAAFIEDISAKYNTVDKYFRDSTTPLLDIGNTIFEETNISNLDFPITIKEMLEKL